MKPTSRYVVPWMIAAFLISGGLASGSVPQEKGFFATLGGLFFSSAESDEKSSGTHQMAGAIVIKLDDQNVEIRTFCVDQKGRLLVAAGGSQFVYRSDADGNYGMEQVDAASAIHVFGPDGRAEAVWAIEVTPEALAVGPDNSVYAAGMGQIVHLDETGKVLATVESPHMEGLPPLPPLPGDEEEEETAEQKEAKAKRLEEISAEWQSLMEKIQESYIKVQDAEKAGDKDALISAQSEYEKAIEPYITLSAEMQSLRMTKRSAAMAERSAALQARSVKSIAVTDECIFVCVPPAKGYASEVWRMDRDFQNSRVIVKGLSGCCGQMNIGAVDGKLVVPENGRMKVHVYDAEGETLCSWGEGESENPISGFGSCCNPMNISFDTAGNVLTSEASVGAIKRFTQSGEFIELVAQSKIVPGCKHTPIGLSPDGTTAYMLDITQKNIIVMKKP